MKVAYQPGYKIPPCMYQQDIFLIPSNAALEMLIDIYYFKKQNKTNLKLCLEMHLGCLITLVL